MYTTEVFIQIRLIRQIRGALTLWFGLFTAINARSRFHEKDCQRTIEIYFAIDS